LIDYDHIGAAIREIRERRGETQETIAARAGFSRSVLTEIESGRRQPNIRHLQRLARALGTTWEIRIGAPIDE
jgi:transcriptional regulator with XRE-family HTH domain